MEYQHKLEDLFKRMYYFREEYLGQQTEHGSKLKTFEDEFGRQLDKSFKKLVIMTNAILGCTNEELDAVVANQHTSNVLAMVRETLAEFHTLRIDADKVLHEQSEYSELVTAKENKYDAFEDEIQKLQNSIQLLCSVMEQALHDEMQNVMIKEVEYHGYEKAFGDYEDLSGFQQLFVANPREKWGSRYSTLAHELPGDEAQMQRHQAELDCLHSIGDRLRREYADLEKEYGASRKMQNCVIEAKMVAAEIYSKVYDMEVALTSPDISLCVEDAIRHILQLTTISVKMIDEDPEVRDFKVSILDQVNQKYGPEQAAELSKERKYLEL
ncbi:unnamed protein product [Penicillium glandicola]